MIEVRRVSRLLGVSLVVMCYACLGNAQVLSSHNPVPATTHPPPAFGTQNYTVTKISALSFVPDFSSRSYGTSGSLGRYGELNVDQHFYAALDIPAGVVIDYVGINNLNDGPNVMAVSLKARTWDGSVQTLLFLDNTLHSSWLTDINSTPLGLLWSGAGAGNFSQELILDVEIAPVSTAEFFAWVEVWWRRTVSPAPFSASFNDVPTSHPFFQYIEALKAAGITGGCQASPPLYCPDRQITRGEMAVFLAKALGLHWPY